MRRWTAHGPGRRSLDRMLPSGSRFGRPLDARADAPAGVRSRGRDSSSENKPIRNRLRTSDRQTWVTSIRSSGTPRSARAPRFVRRRSQVIAASGDTVGLIVPPRCGARSQAARGPPFTFVVPKTRRAIPTQTHPCLQNHWNSSTGARRSPPAHRGPVTGGNRPVPSARHARDLERAAHRAIVRGVGAARSSSRRPHSRGVADPRHRSELRTIAATSPRCCSGALLCGATQAL
jgi:hypothetical protein